jgi:hypothetical protein
LGNKGIIKKRKYKKGGEVYGHHYIFMIANFSYISTKDKMAKRQRYFQFIKIFKKRGLVKPSISQENKARQGNDTEYGLHFWKGRPFKTKQNQSSRKTL